MAAYGGQGAGRKRAQLPLLRQLSIRDEVSLFASHPPHELRARMIEERTWREPAVVLTEARAAQIDAELSREYERSRRALGWTG